MHIRIHSIALIISISLLTHVLRASPLEPIALWAEGAVPGEADSKLPPESVELRGNHKIEIMSNVSTPMLTIYPAPEEKRNGASVVVCPGGGYNILAYSHEGKEVCEWLNSIGVTAALLKYRVPRRENLEKHHAPLQDAQRAISLLRSRAGEWKLDANRVGILGFSAGGNLAAMALTSDGSRTYPIDPKIDSVSCVPDFGILVYPAYLLDEKNPDVLDPKLSVNEKTPPAFLVVAHDDKRFVEGAARFYIEMRRKDRESELHIYAKGGHGFGFKNTEEAIKAWPKQAGEWMGVLGFLRKGKQQ